MSVRISGLRVAAARLLRPSSTATATATAARHFSGNVEYPRIEGSVTEVSTNLATIGARLSMPTAALYLTKQKIEYVVRGIKTPAELREVQRVLLLCDSKYAFPTDFAIGSFFAAAVKLQAPEVALEFLREAQHLRRYLPNQSVVRLASYYASQEDDEAVAEITKIVDASGVTKTQRWYNFQIQQAKKKGELEAAIAIAKQAAGEKQINAHAILTLIEGFEGDALAEHLPLVKYLVAKGDVFPNEKLTQVLQQAA